MSPKGYHRTWLERYVHFKDGTVRVDNVPETGAVDLPAVDPATVDRSYFVPKLCNHCEDPPCNQVCPVHAAFSSPEGFTLVDAQRCIGCAYCVQPVPMEPASSIRRQAPRTNAPGAITA